MLPQIDSIYQLPMIKTFSSPESTNLFYKNSYGFLIHEWSRLPNETMFNYQVISQGVIGRPAIIEQSGMFNIYYVNSNNFVSHVRISKQAPRKFSEQIIYKNMVDSSMNLVCCQVQHEVCVFCVDQNQRIVKLSHHKTNGYKIEAGFRKSTQISYHKQELAHYAARYVGNPQGQLSMLKSVSDKNVSFLFYKVQKDFYWISLNEEQKEARRITLPFEVDESQNYKVYLKNQSINLFIVNSSSRVCEVILNAKSQNIEDWKQLGDLSVLAGCPISLAPDQKYLNIWFATSKNEIASYSRKVDKGNWRKQRYFLEGEVGQALLIKFMRNRLRLFFLDSSQVLVQYGILQEIQLHITFTKLPQRPYLVWNHIKDRCKFVGKGYHTDCYLYEELNIAIKQYRTYSRAFDVRTEIGHRQNLELIEPDLVGYRLIKEGVLIGFSLPYYKGHQFGHFLKSHDSILVKSPIARVKLMVQLAQQVSNIQTVNICHGSIRMGNMIISVDEKESTILEPKLCLKLVDFGNSFTMRHGETVSRRGITTSNLIPPEVKKCQEVNYSPFGVNPYQLGVNCLQIMLGENESGAFNAEKNIQKLVENRNYPQEIKQWVKQLIHKDPARRVKALYHKISHFETVMKQFYIEKQNRSRTNVNESPKMYKVGEKIQNISKRVKTSTNSRKQGLNKVKK